MKALRNTLTLFIFVWIVAFPACRVCAEEGFEYRWIPVGLQVSTSISDGVFSLDDVVDAAHETGLNALIVTDRDVMRWEYGLWPLRRLFRRTIEASSISTYGFSNYLQDIEFYSKKYPELILIPGTETAPFYCWRGSLLMRTLKLCDWHRQILVVGLTEPQDYRDLPVVSHPASIRRALRWSDIFRLFPFAMIALGVLVFFRREYPYKDEKGRECGRFSMKGRVAGVAAVLLGVLFLTNESPFLPVAYDPFTRNAGYSPYQRMIDYVHEHGGLTFWAHPEAANVSGRDGIGIETAAHPEALVETTGYTGFAIFSEGYKVVGRPGGAWDQALIAYCRGAREEPVWAVAGMSFDQGSKEELKARMRGTRTYVLADALNWHHILEAMRRGRMYATVGGRERPVLLREFSVMDSSNGQKAGPGRTFVVSGSAIIALTAGLQDEDEGEGAVGGADEGEGKEETAFPAHENQLKDVKVTVVRNGAVIKEDDLALPVRFIYVDPVPLSGKTYYRAVIKRGPQIIATNPIFVEPKGT